MNNCDHGITKQNLCLIPHLKFSCSQSHQLKRNTHQNLNSNKVTNERFNQQENGTFQEENFV